MENEQHKFSIKKRIMFNKEEDYYFIVYNILIFLNVIGCVDEKNRFQDYNKLAYLIPFISNHYLLDIQNHFIKLGRTLIREERELLRKTYIKSRMSIKIVTSIIFLLNRNKIITLKANTIRNSIDIWVNIEEIPEGFFDSALYKLEIEQSNIIKKLFPRIKSLKIETLVESLFTNKGVIVWPV